MNLFPLLSRINKCKKYYAPFFYSDNILPVSNICNQIGMTKMQGKRFVLKMHSSWKNAVVLLKLEKIK